MLKAHHASQLRCIDKNDSQVLSVWDRVFVSFEPDGEAAPPECSHDGMCRSECPKYAAAALPPAE